jgi:TAG lipase/lysophosphatidylethanolamine acyltransferase
MLKRIWAWFWQKSTRDLLLETIAEARQYEEWEAAAVELDRCLNYDMWYAYSSQDPR